MRTVESHTQYCSALGDTLGSHIATTYGVSRNSILNSLRYFHIIDGLPPDIMHDVLEGALPLEIKLLLSQFLLDRIFTLDQLNNRIKAYPYGEEDRTNKPSQILLANLNTNDTSFKQSGNKVIHVCLFNQLMKCCNYVASQLWCLGRYLPLLIGDLIPERNENWECFLLLLEIMDILFAPCISEDQVSYLRILIKVCKYTYIVCIGIFIFIYIYVCTY